LPDSDAAVSRERTLAHLAEIVASVDLPVSADFQSGYGVQPEEVADSVARCVATGVAGLSIEDSTGDPSAPLYELPLAVERVRAARAAIDGAGGGVLLTARAECFLVGTPDALRESVLRLQAYADAGADVLFAPGPHKPDEIRTLVAQSDLGRSISWSPATSGSAWPTSRRSACGASASAPPSRWRRGAPSCARRAPCNRKAASRGWPARRRTPRSTTS
jgi:2-methylisocitrate lyase-like PEP mutase family enzyme